MSIKNFFDDENYKILKSNLLKLSQYESFAPLKGVLYSFDVSEKMLYNMLYFIMIQGRLKTGKSTFINILTNEKVAVTKIDNDTTKVPYIITKSRDDKNKIIRYIQLKNIPKNRYRDIFNAILNDIMDVEAEEYDAEVAQFFTKKEEDFTLDNVREYTSDNLSNENLLINIQIKPNKYSILNENIAIVDTPGVGGKSYENQNELVKYIRQRIDMLFLLQSTLTPFDEILLKELDTFSRDLNMRLIHNSFELKPWANENEKNRLIKEEDDLIKKAKSSISHKIRSDIPVNRFNFGKIEDYLNIIEYKNKLKGEFDKYDDFRKNIINYIKKNRQKDREKTVIRRIKNNILELEEFLKIQKEKYEDFINGILSDKNQLYLSMNTYLDFMEMEISNINFMLEPFSLNTLIMKYFNECMKLAEKNLMDIKVGFFKDSENNLKLIKNFSKNIEECINKKLIDDIYKKLLKFFDQFKDTHHRVNDIIFKISNQFLPFFEISQEGLSKIVIDYEEEEIKEIFLKSIEKEYVVGLPIKNKINYEKLKNNIKEYFLNLLKNEVFNFNEKIKNDLNEVFKNYKGLCVKLRDDLGEILEKRNKEKLEYYYEILNLIRESIDKIHLLKIKYVQS